MIHFFTIVLNGMPFIKYHIDVFKSLDVEWHWHIVEGVAELKFDTAWSLGGGGHIPNQFHNGGLSIDGTSEYLMNLLECNRENISIYRRPSGEFWNGKVEMVNTPLENIKEDCLLWQLDSDELWTKENVEKVYRMFQDNPRKKSAYFFCYFFLGPSKYIISEEVKSTKEWDWIRVWRFKPGMKFITHEPPIMVNGNGGNIGLECPFTRKETWERSISFQHFAYATLKSVQFKESYYGYPGVVEHWRRIQKSKGPLKINEKLPWVESGTIIDDWNEKENGKLLWRAECG